MRTDTEILADLDGLRGRRYAGAITEADYHAAHERLWAELRHHDLEAKWAADVATAKAAKAAEKAKRQNQYRAERAALKAAGLPCTLAAAFRAGYEVRSPAHYHAEAELQIRGRLLLLRPLSAHHATDWRREGKRPRWGQKPHGQCVTGWGKPYDVWRPDQVCDISEWENDKCRTERRLKRREAALLGWQNRREFWAKLKRQPWSAWPTLN